MKKINVFTVQLLNNIDYLMIEKNKDKQDQFEVLRKINNKPQSTQRELSSELGFGKEK